MYSGKTVFAQLMDCLPWSTFSRLVARYGGDYDVRTFPCVEQYRAMAFAQLTYRESLRDIEACLSAQPAKLYHMGFRGPIRRSTLADANETRDWRIHAEFAQRLIVQARRLYVGESLSVDLKDTVYALDSTTIDLCLSLFPWAHFRSTKAAVKTQIWIAVSVYVLAAIVRKRLKLDVSLYTLMQVFSVTVFEKVSIESVIFQTTSSSAYVMDDNQLNSKK